MGLCLSHFSLHDDIDTVSLAHVENIQQNNTKNSQYEGRNRFHRKKNCPYPLPNDPAEINR
jgi:hypothetical protein